MEQPRPVEENRLHGQAFRARGQRLSQFLEIECLPVSVVHGRQTSTLLSQRAIQMSVAAIHNQMLRCRMTRLR
jgi:hypothetical protein